MISEFEAYHGSNKDFSSFDASYISSSVYGWGFYFTTDIDLAKDYGKKIYTVELLNNDSLLNLDIRDASTKENFFNLLKEKLFELIKSENPQLPIDTFNEKLESIQKYVKAESPLYEIIWMFESLFIACFNGYAKKGKKYVSDIIKSLNYAGCKHNVIICIFDPNKVKITKKEENELYDESVEFNFQNIVNESLSQKAYHFTNIDRFYDMVDHDMIRFSRIEKGTREKVLGNGKPYFLSATRVRDSRFGYSQGFNVRIELNADAFNANYKSKPVSFFKGASPTQSSKEYYSYPKKYEVGELPYYKRTQTRTENEDRILSDKPCVKHIERYITRVDIYIEIYDSIIPHLKEYSRKLYEQLRDLYNSKLGTCIFVYNNKDEFDKQGKNITDKILKVL